MYMEAITAPKWAGSSVRKLNFDFAPMLRYGVLGPKVIRWVKCCVGGGLRYQESPDWLAFNLLCDCCLAVFAFVFVFWVAHLGLPM